MTRDHELYLLVNFPVGEVKVEPCTTRVMEPHPGPSNSLLRPGSQQLENCNSFSDGLRSGK